MKTKDMLIKIIRKGGIVMKVFIVVNDYSDMETHCEYRDCFIDEIKAYQYALLLSNKNEFGTVRVIEKDFSREESKEE